MAIYVSWFINNIALDIRFYDDSLIHVTYYNKTVNNPPEEWDVNTEQDKFRLSRAIATLTYSKPTK